MFSFFVFAVPQWQKRYTVQGDFTTAYISNQYQKKFFPRIIDYETLKHKELNFAFMLSKPTLGNIVCTDLVSVDVLQNASLMANISDL